MPLIKKLVLEAGDAQLVSQKTALQELIVALQEEVAPLQTAVDNAFAAYNVTSQAASDALAALVLAEAANAAALAAYEAALATLSNNSAELQAVQAAVPDLLDQSAPILIIEAAALRLNLLDTTSTDPNGQPPIGG